MPLINGSGAGGALNSYRRVNSSLNSTAGKLATGSRINKASDDAAGLAISELMRAELKGISAAEGNISLADDRMEVANGALQNANDILGRMKELSVGYNNSFLNSDQKAALSSEFDALKNELSRTFNDTSFNGEKLFTASPVELATDASGATQSIEGLDASAAAAASGGSLSISNVGSVETAIRAVTDQRTELGASQSQLEFTLSALQENEVNTANAESRIRDLDFAKGATQFASDRIRQQYNVAVLGQSNSSAQGVLRLLQ